MQYWISRRRRDGAGAGASDVVDAAADDRAGGRQSVECAAGARKGLVDVGLVTGDAGRLGALRPAGRTAGQDITAQRAVRAEGDAAARPVDDGGRAELRGDGATVRDQTRARLGAPTPG